MTKKQLIEFINKNLKKINPQISEITDLEKDMITMLQLLEASFSNSSKNQNIPTQKEQDISTQMPLYFT